MRIRGPAGYPWRRLVGASREDAGAPAVGRGRSCRAARPRHLRGRRHRRPGAAATAALPLADDRRGAGADAGAARHLGGSWQPRLEGRSRGRARAASDLSRRGTRLKRPGCRSSTTARSSSAAFGWSGRQPAGAAGARAAGPRRCRRGLCRCAGRRARRSSSRTSPTSLPRTHRATLQISGHTHGGQIAPLRLDAAASLPTTATACLGPLWWRTGGISSSPAARLRRVSLARRAGRLRSPSIDIGEK